MLEAILNHKNKVIVVLGIGLTAYYLKIKKSKKSKEKIEVIEKEGNKKKKRVGLVNAEFLKKVWKLLKISIPSLFGKETFSIVVLTGLLVARTILSIYVSDLKGSWVRCIVKRDLPKFIMKLIAMTLYSIPSAMVNSGLTYYNNLIAVYFRQNLTSYLQKEYLKTNCYYQITNLDTRIAHPDQIFATDVELWATSISNLYSNISKPLLDLILMLRKLAETMGYTPPILMLVWYGISAVFLKMIAPPFGELIANQQNIEGEYRACHSSLITHSEEISFFRGHIWEKTKLNEIFAKLFSHIHDINKKKMYMGIYDSLLTKYGAVLAGYCLLGFPVFSGSERYTVQFQNDSSIITKDFIRNSGLMVNLAKATGKVIYSYKDLQNLAGYTHLVDELCTVITEVNDGKYVRPQVNEELLKKYVGGSIEEEDFIEFDRVPIITPNGDVLIPEMKFVINQGCHTLISGPNGCGKSSLFRILGALWPIKGGVLKKPNYRNIFYIPQKPYLPQGTLRDQIIYPHSFEEFKSLNKKDEDLMEFLKFFEIDGLKNRYAHGFDEKQDWNEVLAWGEKQMIAMARCYYHCPKYAILDECSSAVSIDMEARMYSKAKEMNITLITVSHRKTVWKYHDYILRFNGDLSFSFEKLLHE